MVHCGVEFLGPQQCTQVLHEVVQKVCSLVRKQGLSGTPKTGTTSSIKALAIRMDFWSGIVLTMGHFLRKSWNTKTWQLPLYVLVRCMTLTTKIWNGRQTGIGYKGECVGLPPPVTTAHSGQLQANCMESTYIPFHHQCFAKEQYILFPKKCPPTNER